MKMLIFMSLFLALLAYGIYTIKTGAPDFEALIEQNPTAAGEVETRPGYFRKAP
jgi:hypothetical protein